MNRIISNSLKILATASFISPLLGNSSPQEEPERLNVLFISVDDLRYQARVFGQREMITPGLDRFADEGVVFSRAYCQVPVCGASRASLLSGARPSRERFVNFYARKDEDLPGKPSIPAWFKEHGYTTRSIGKIYHHNNDDMEAWSFPPVRPQAGVGWQAYLTEESHRIIEENRDPDNPQQVKGPAYEMADVPDNHYPDGQVTEMAIDALKGFAESGEPFFLAAGFFKPHLPFNAPQKYWDLYEEMDLVLADNPFPPKDAPAAAMHGWHELRGMYTGIPQTGPVSPELEKKLVHGYYACVSYIDAQINMLLDALEELGLADNTVVVVWGDHGFHLGEHGLWVKHCNFDRVISAPLLFKGPGVTQGAVSQTLVEFIDIYPSLAELAGLPLPDHLDGKSLAPTLKNPETTHKSAVYSRYHDGESVKTDQFLYTEYVDDSGRIYAKMLYDHKYDPKENINVAERPEYADVVEEHSLMLERLRTKVNN